MRLPALRRRAHLRKPTARRAWALVIASYILYVPANVCDMETTSLFGAQRDTILSGVVFLWRSARGPSR